MKNSSGAGSNFNLKLVIQLTLWCNDYSTWKGTRISWAQTTFAKILFNKKTILKKKLTVIVDYPS